MKQRTQKDGRALGASPSKPSIGMGENRVAFMLEFSLFDCINLNAAIYEVLEMAVGTDEVTDLSPGDAARILALVKHSRSISFFITEDLESAVNRKVS